MSDDGLTMRQRIYDFIVAYKREHDGLSPAIKEIADTCQIGFSTVRYHLWMLEIDGRIRAKGRRSIEVIGGVWDLPDEEE
ncbi:MAG: hypothetical protein JW910_14315 [Anaerolineae bacterium]|nr:hypothetical protein [Anaerolineae bacterium]